jgi:hypothetical protein
MNHDQLVRVFPDGRTVHVPTDGKPLKGYELALADIEKRGPAGNVSSSGMPGLFAALFGKAFGSKSNDEDDEGANAPVARERASPTSVMASAAPAKSADPVPMPRAKPVVSTFQLASADARIVQPAKSKQAASAGNSEAKPQTPADIINARGFWDAVPTQATPEQVTAINARKALASADSQSTASISEAFRKALAYAPATSSSPVDRSNIVAASAPMPRSARPAPRIAMAATTIDTVVAKGPQGQGGVIATSARIAASRGNDVWMRVMILAPNASTSMSATVMGDSDMTLMRVHFVKPPAVVAMSFADDPQLGLVCDHFTGSATDRLATQSFVTRTAALR